MTASLRSALLLSGASIVVPLAGPAAAQDNAAAYLERGAKGDLTQPGGARRIAGDVTAALQAAINDGDVKNVILFIGDGMGDSEITVARNFAEGAGGFFKGIDAPPITGQYTHYALDRETGRPSYVHRFGGLRVGMVDRDEDLQRTPSRRHQGGAAHDPRSSSPRLPASAPAMSPPPRLQDATPAVQVAHVAQRSCYGPEVTSREVPEGCAGERRLGLDHRADARHPPRRDARRRGQVFRRDRQGRRLEGQDPARSGQGARLPGRHRLDRAQRRHRRRTTPRRCSACSPPATCRSAGRVRRPPCTAIVDQPPVTCTPNAERAAACRRWPT